MKRKMIVIILIIMSSTVITFLLINNKNAKRVPIIGYHHFVKNDIKQKYYKDDEWVDSIDNLEYQLRILKLFGYKSLSLDEYYCWHNGSCKQSKNSVLLTFDDGDRSFYYDVIPILEKFNFKATVFIIGENTNDKEGKYYDASKRFLSMEEINDIKENHKSIEVESHSYGLHKMKDSIPIVYSLNEEELQKDVEKMKNFDTEYFCYPGGAYTDELINVLKRNDYKLAFKYDKSEISSPQDDDYLIPRISINGLTTKTGYFKWIIKSIIYNI